MKINLNIEAKRAEINFENASIRIFGKVVCQSNKFDYPAEFSVLVPWKGPVIQKWNDFKDELEKEFNEK